MIKEIDDIIEAADEEEVEPDSEVVQLEQDPYSQQRSFLPRSRIVNQALKGGKIDFTPSFYDIETGPKKGSHMSSSISVI